LVVGATSWQAHFRVKDDEDRPPFARLDVARPVAFAGRVFKQEDFTAPQSAELAVRDLDLDCAIE
jgi:hypothetical protein